MLLALTDTPIKYNVNTIQYYNTRFSLLEKWDWGGGSHTDTPSQLAPLPH